MKKAITTAVFLLAFGVSSAMAQPGLNLSWDECTGNGGVSDKTFACNTNSGASFVMNASVIPVSSFNTFASASSVIDVHVDDVTLPPWWQTNTGQCRPNQVTINFDPTLNTTTCTDIWAFSTIVQVSAMQQGVNGPNRVRVNGLAAIPAGSEVPMVADGTELWVSKVTIFRGSTLSCTGCATGACIVFNETKLLSPTETQQVITNQSTRRWVLWQGGGTTNCPTDTPAINRTWGAVKNLYR